MKCVSIIIPIYNLENYLKDCLESVLCQTYANIEVILIDDGSRDNSLQICREYSLVDKRVKVLSQKNHGVSYARNRGIEEAKGEYLLFVDGDDCIEPFYVERYLSAAEQNKADIVIGGITFLMLDGEVKEKRLVSLGKFEKELWNIVCLDETGLFGYVSNKLYRTELLKKNKIFFNEAMYVQEDLDFALSAYGVGKKFYLIDFCGYIYRYTPDKRHHPLIQYIQNQLKMLLLAKTQINLLSEAEMAVISRIYNLEYTYLYYLPIDSKFVSECAKLEVLVKFEAYTRDCPIKGEQKFIHKLVLRRKYEVLKYYFCIRHILRRILRGNTV